MKVYVILADGFEEIEALIPVDILRRGGVETIMVSIKRDKIVISAHEIPVLADMVLEQIKVEPDDMLVLPGGSKGVANLKASELFMKLLKQHQTQKGWIAAICAGPTIPGKLGYYEGLKATCYPGCEDDLIGANILEDPVVVDQNFITSRAPGTSFEFAYAILKILKGHDITEEIKKAMIY